MKTFEYAGKSWEYDDLTIFLLELGRHENTYKTQKEFAEWLYDSPVEVAIATYECFHVSKGYKKRLSMMNNDRKTIIAREISKRNPK